MSNPTDLISIKGGATKNAFAESLRTLRENLQLHLEYVAIEAKIKRAKYLALVQEGFSEQQALELCK